MILEFCSYVLGDVIKQTWLTLTGRGYSILGRCNLFGKLYGRSDVL